MPLRSRKRGSHFEIQVQDVVLRIHAAEEMYEEARAAGLAFAEQVQSYGIRDPAFRTSRRPVEVPGDAPALVRRIAELAGRAGVGPMFAVQGALTEHVGRAVGGERGEVVVSSGGSTYVVTGRRSRLVVHPGRAMADGTAGTPIAVVVKPELGPQGIFTTYGRPRLPVETDGAVAVVAESCILADAAGAGALMLLDAKGAAGFRAALEYLRRIPGVHGGIVLRGSGIGFAGALEIAA